MRGLSVSNTVLLIIRLMYLILFVAWAQPKKPDLAKQITSQRDPTYALCAPIALIEPVAV
jgi:hypothetical protein